MIRPGRKVRAPEGRVLRNAESRQREGKCHRKGNHPVLNGERVKRCLPQADSRRSVCAGKGKSSPVPRVTGQLGKPHPEQGQIGSASRGAPSDSCFDREAERVRPHDPDCKVRAERNDYRPPAADYRTRLMYCSGFFMTIFLEGPHG